MDNKFQENKMFVTIAEASKITGISRFFFYTHKDLPFIVRFGRHIRINLEQLMKGGSSSDYRKHQKN